MSDLFATIRYLQKRGMHDAAEKVQVLNDRLAESEAQNAALKARVAELEKTVKKCRQAYFAPPLDAAPKTPEDYRRTCDDLLAALKGASR